MFPYVPKEDIELIKQERDLYKIEMIKNLDLYE